MRTLGNVKPTPEQLKILADANPGFRLIRGAAGSGKTTAALMRVRQLCASRLQHKARLGLQDDVRVLVLTFNRTLRGYIAQLAEEQRRPSKALHLRVDTLAKWARSVVGNRRLWSDEKRRSFIEGLLQDVGVGTNLPYFVGEVEYILGRFSPRERQAYIGIQRSGRGRAPAVPRTMREKFLSQVVVPYEEYKAQKDLVDWDDVALEAAEMGKEDYDVVVVDETQDFSANQMRAVLAHLKQDHVTTFIIDAVQRIYPRGFTWREIGIEMRPNMVFNLKTNHRNTAQIALLANSLVRGLPLEEDGVFPNADTCSRQGARPVIVSGKYSSQLRYMLGQLQPALDAGDTVAILQPRGGAWFCFTEQELEKRHLDYCQLTRQTDWPTGTEQVALSTIHSAKGLEFDHVLLPGLNREIMPHGDDMEDGELDSLRRLVAMGVGRARHTVYLGYKPEDRSPLIDLIDRNTYDLVEA